MSCRYVMPVSPDAYFIMKTKAPKIEDCTTWLECAGRTKTYHVRLSKGNMDFPAVVWRPLVLETMYRGGYLCLFSKLLRFVKNADWVWGMVQTLGLDRLDCKNLTELWQHLELIGSSDRPKSTFVANWLRALIGTYSTSAWGYSHCRGI